MSTYLQKIFARIAAQKRQAACFGAGGKCGRQMQTANADGKIGGRAARVARAAFFGRAGEYLRGWHFFGKVLKIRGRRGIMGA